MSTGPLHPEQHSEDGLVNVVTAKVVSNPKVDVNHAITTRAFKVNSFEAK